MALPVGLAIPSAVVAAVVDDRVFIDAVIVVGGGAATGGGVDAAADVDDIVSCNKTDRYRVCTLW